MPVRKPNIDTPCSCLCWYCKHRYQHHRHHRASPGSCHGTATVNALSPTIMCKPRGKKSEIGEEKNSKYMHVCPAILFVAQGPATQAAHAGSANRKQQAVSARRKQNAPHSKKGSQPMHGARILLLPPHPTPTNPSLALDLEVIKRAAPSQSPTKKRLLCRR